MVRLKRGAARRRMCGCAFAPRPRRTSRQSGRGGLRCPCPSHRHPADDSGRRRSAARLTICPAARCCRRPSAAPAHRRAHPTSKRCPRCSIEAGRRSPASIIDRDKFIDLPIPELYDLRRDPGEQTNLDGQGAGARTRAAGGSSARSARSCPASALREDARSDRPLASARLYRPEAPASRRATPKRTTRRSSSISRKPFTMAWSSIARDGSTRRPRCIGRYRPAARHGAGVQAPGVCRMAARQPARRARRAAAGDPIRRHVIVHRHSAWQLSDG